MVSDEKRSDEERQRREAGPQREVERRNAVGFQAGL
jgi:hypothetical protein